MNENSYATAFNGTTFTVTLFSSDNAKKTFEDLIKNTIRQEAVKLPAD